MTHKKHLLLAAITTMLVTLVPQVAQATSTQRSSAHATLQPRTASVTVCVGVGVPHNSPPKGYVITAVGSAFSPYNPGPCGQNNGWGINSQVWSKLVSGTTVCVGVGSSTSGPPSGYVITKVASAGPIYNPGPCGQNNGWGINSQVWSTLSSGSTVCVGVGSSTPAVPVGYVITKVASAGPIYNPGPCGQNNGWGINSQVWSKLVNGSTVCVGVGSPTLSLRPGYVITKVLSAGPTYNPGPCGQNNGWGVNAQVWSKLVSGMTVCVGPASSSSSPPSGFVITKVLSSGPYYNLGPCGTNNGWGINAHVWTKLVSGTTVCMGLGVPQVKRPASYVVTKVGVAGPYYNLGPCGANNGSGFNSQVWSLR